MNYLLDTDICLFFLKGKYGLNQKIRLVGVEKCFISEITVLELIYGAKNTLKYEEYLNDVAIVQELFEVIPIEIAFEKFALEKVKLRKAGLLIPDFDLLIGSSAVTLSMMMVTNNEKHLQRIDGISIENWTSSVFNEFAAS